MKHQSVHIVRPFVDGKRCSGRRELHHRTAAWHAYRGRVRAGSARNRASHWVCSWPPASTFKWRSPSQLSMPPKSTANRRTAACAINSAQMPRSASPTSAADCSGRTCVGRLTTRPTFFHASYAANELSSVSVLTATSAMVLKPLRGLSKVTSGPLSFRIRDAAVAWANGTL